MARFYDCSMDYPGDVKCTLVLAADNKEDLLEAVVRHGVKVHGCQDTPEFREKIMKGMKEGIPRTNR